jgi:cellulose synthase/poly-beta-1,6-N-acetylglucosamine synthase-like glycosyltransferase
MIDMLLIPVAILYLLTVGLLFIYGINFFYLTYIAMRESRSMGPSLEMNTYPYVTVQLPIYNELYVTERLISAAAALDYPHDRFEIQVLDDSTDETEEIIAKMVERVRAKGVCISHIRRAERHGYKAGALAYGLRTARGEYLAIFDADFIPIPDFLIRVLPHFSKPEIGFVQARWGHINSDYSVLTLLQSLAVDAHFMVEQFARSRGGYWFNFNGTAGVWRRSALESVGGWQADTLTEDLDLSYRAFLGGWRAAYAREVCVPAELPVSISAYRRQQGRWARGSLECAIKFMPAIWRAPISMGRKLEATLHLTGYGVHLLLFALAVLYPLVLLLSREYANLISLFGIAFVFNLTAFAPTIFFVAAQQQLGRRWWQKLPLFLLISAFGAGMMLNTLRAAIQALGNRPGAFERTPKYGVARRGQEWAGRRYQLEMDSLTYLEMVFALLNAGTAVLALSFGNWAIAVYASLFCIGLAFISGLTIIQTLAARRRNKISGQTV